MLLTDALRHHFRSGGAGLILPASNASARVTPGIAVRLSDAHAKNLHHTCFCVFALRVLRFWDEHAMLYAVFIYAVSDLAAAWRVVRPRLRCGVASRVPQWGGDCPSS